MFRWLSLPLLTGFRRPVPLKAPASVFAGRSYCHQSRSFLIAGSGTAQDAASPACALGKGEGAPVINETIWAAQRGAVTRPRDPRPVRMYVRPFGIVLVDRAAVYQRASLHRQFYKNSSLAGHQSRGVDQG